MNNQMPYNFFSNMMPNNDGYCCRKNDNRIDKLENKIKQLDRRITLLENSLNYQTPYFNSTNQEPMPNNYI